MFDAMAFYFRDESVAAAAVQQKDQIIAAYQRASEDVEFQEALQTTTKTPAATWRRLADWGNALALVLGMSLPQLELHDSRIVVR